MVMNDVTHRLKIVKASMCQPTYSKALRTKHNNEVAIRMQGGIYNIMAWGRNRIKLKIQF
jgi:hypothetical protein